MTQGLGATQRWDPQKWQKRRSKRKGVVRYSGLPSCSFPRDVDVAQLLCLTHRAEAAPNWGPKSLLPLLPTLPSPSLRFQYNFQLTSMSIEQVGQPDCWPITGNHSAPQLSAQGEKGGQAAGGDGSEPVPSLQAGKRVGFSGGVQQPLGGTGGGAGGVGEGEAYRPPAGGSSSPYTELWVLLLCNKDLCSKPQRERTGD